MADFSQVDDVAAANIAQINDVPFANCGQVNDCTKAASGATVWVQVKGARDVAFASNSDLTSWTTYDARAIGGDPPGSAVDFLAVTYGKDGSGSARWCASLATDNGELMYKDNAAASGDWTVVQNDFRLFDLCWGNNVWLAVGQMSSGAGQNVLRSTDGATWSEVDVSGVSGTVNTSCYAVVYSGSGGTFYFAQQNRIYKSTDSGASWSLAHTLVDSGGSDPGDIRSLQVTNNSMVAYVKGGGEIFSCALSDDTDWSTETSLTSAANVNLNSRVAAGNGRWVMVYNAKYWAADINGKTITLEHNNADISSDTHGNANAICTDGSGKFVVGCTDGDILVSTDNADSFSKQGADAVSGSEEAEAMAGDIYLPV